MTIHSGSWMGLPDFGITEKVGSLFNKQPTYQGGSNLIGSYPQPKASTGEVLGANINYNTPYDYNANLQPRTTTPPPSNTGGGQTDLRNPSQNPGAGFWWDAANGWQYSGGNASDEAARRENELRNTIGSGYDQLFQNYQNLIPSYEQQRGERLGSASDIYNQIAQGLGQTRQSAIDKLGLAKQQVGQNIGNSVKDLQQNLLGVVRNTGMQLGAMGAGDTSAANVMAPYAYTKMAGQEYGKIQRQGNDQLFQIDTQTRDTENQYNQMINDVEIEKQSKFDEIKQYYGSLIANVRERMANLPAEKAQAMSGVIEGALNEARNRLATVENYAMQKQGELQSWAQNRMAQLNDAKIQLSNSANFSPQDIVWQELQARNMTNSTPQSTAYWNPEVMKKRREEMGYGA